jgi:hypothetical protein
VLHALLASNGVEPEDVVWLVTEAMEHPPDVEGPKLVSRGFDYELVLRRAVRAVRAPGAVAPLTHIASGRARCPRRSGRRLALSEHWARQTLAAGHPEASLPFLERLLGDSHAWARRRIVEALAEVPEELAVERLERAARDPAHEVADRAQSLALSRLKRAFEVSPLEAVMIDLLPEPPSERFSARLLVLRGRSEEARLAMLEALLAEAPDTEALVLLVFALQGDCVQNYGGKRQGLPNCAKDWAQALLDRFGGHAGEALLRLAERSRDGAWLSALVRSLDALPAGARDRLRPCAVELLRSPVQHDWNDALDALPKLGVPVEAASRLWAVAFDGEPWYLTFGARRALAALPDPDADARLLLELSSALEERRFNDVTWLLELGFERRTPGVEDRAVELIVAPHPELTTGLRFICHLLDERGRIDDAWLLRALADPEGEAFALAARLFGNRRKPSGAAQTLLFDALASQARSGRSAVDAAFALICTDLLLANDERLESVVAAAPIRERVELIAFLAYQEELSYETYSRWILPFLRSPEPRIAHRALDCLLHENRTPPELLGRLYPEIVVPEVRDRVDRALQRRPPRGDDYWLDLEYVYDAERADDAVTDEFPV